MLRGLCLTVTAVLSVGVGLAELDACGDKFLRAGRSARISAYAAVHPTAILIYVPATAREADVKQWVNALNRGGHRPRAVRGSDAFRQALAASTFDIVLSSYQDAPAVKAMLTGVSSRPELVPIVPRRRLVQWDAIEREYGHALKDDQEAVATLVELDHVMEVRLAAAAQGALSR